MNQIDDILKAADSAAGKALLFAKKGLEAYSDEEMQKIIGIDRERLRHEIAKHPSYISYFAEIKYQLQHAIVRCKKSLEILDGELYDFYKHEYEINLSTSEIKHYITHDSRHRDIESLLLALDEYHGRVSSILESLTAKGYSLNNLVKLVTLDLEQKKLERY